MPYIGRDLNRGNYLKLDDISSSFNSSTQTFNLTVGGSAFTPGSAFAILVSVGGVIQEPESAYQVNNSEITFANAPTAQDSFFCIALGVALGIGVPGNGTVNGTQMAKPFNYDGYFYLDDANNRVGINSSSPTVALDVDGIIKASSFTGGSGGINAGVGTFTGLDVNGNGDISGNLVLGGDLTVNGTTSTIDTNLIGVDRVEVGANSSTIAGIAVTQSGTADLVRLYDGASQVVTVDDEGRVGLGSATPTARLDVSPTIQIKNTALNGTANLDINAANGGQCRINLYAGVSGGVNRATRIDFHNQGSAQWMLVNDHSQNGTNYFSIRHGNKVAIQCNPDSTVSLYDDGDESLRTDVAGILVPEKVIHLGDTDTFMKFDTNTISFETGGIERVSITGAGVSIKSGNPSLRLQGTSSSFGDTAKIIASRNNDGSLVTGSIVFDPVNAAGADIIFNTRDSNVVGERVRIKNDGKVGIGSENPVGVLDLYHATNNTILNVKSGDSGSVINLIDNATRSSIEQNGASLKIISDTDAAYANSEIRFQVDGATKLLIDTAGRILINRTSTHSSSSERLSVNGMTSIQLNSTSTAPLYVFNQETTADGTIQPFMYFSDGAGLRAGIGVQYSTSRTIINGQFGLSFRSGSSGVGGTERLFITSTGNVGINQTSPQRILHVGESGTAEANIRIQGGSDYGEIRVKDSDNELSFHHNVGGAGSRELFSSNGSTGHFSINCYTYQALTITTNENGTNGPELSLFHNSASPAASDSIAQIRFNAKDSAGNTDLYARIHANLASPTSGSESGDLVFSTRGSGTFAERVRIRSNGNLVVNNSVGSVLELTRTNTNTSGLCGKVVFGNTDWDSSMASIQAYQDGGNDNASLRFYTQASAAGAEQERLRITSAGRILVNSTNVYGSIGGNFHVVNTNMGLNSFANNPHAQTFHFTKSRATSGQGGTIVQDNDFCGHIEWYADDGVDTANQIAKISARIDGTPGANDTPGELLFYTTADGANASTERVRITASGDFQEKSDGTNWYNVVTGYDIGTNPNEIPINQMLGGMAYMDPTNYEQVYEIPSTNADHFNVQSSGSPGGQLAFGTVGGGCPDPAIAWPDDTSGNPIDLWVIDFALHCTGVTNSGRNDLYFKMRYNTGSTTYGDSSTEWNNWILARKSYNSTSAGWNQINADSASTWGRTAVFMDATQYATGHIILFRGGAGAATRPGLMWDFNYTHGGVGATRAFGSAHATMGNDGNATRRVASLSYDLDAASWISGSAANSQNIAGFVRQRGFRLQ